MTRLEVAKAVHQSARAPTPFAQAPHRFTRSHEQVVAPCDKRATNQLRSRMMPPVAKPEVGKAANALAPTTVALVPHRLVNLPPETAIQGMYIAWGATYCGWNGAAPLYAGHPSEPRALQ